VVAQSEDGGHSQAASAGARAAIELDADRVAMLPTDCPLFDPDELDDRLGRTPRAVLIVPDHARTGTNALVLNPPDAFEPAFGPDSCARHVSRARAAGLSFAMEDLPSLARDLDTPEDMNALRDTLLLAPERALRSAQVLWEIGAEDSEQPSSSPLAAA
jgi:2-phospho-L-lactate guanylyltransferase